jgi:hypothetical protein
VTGARSGEKGARIGPERRGHAEPTAVKGASLDGQRRPNFNVIGAATFDR